MLNPYEPSANTPASAAPEPARQRWIAIINVGWGLLSWMAFIYATNQIIYMQPNAVFLSFVGFLCCAVFGWLSALTGVFGIYIAFRRQWHPWKVAAAYAVITAILCYPSVRVTMAFITGDQL